MSDPQQAEALGKLVQKGGSWVVQHAGSLLPQHINHDNVSAAAVRANLLEAQVRRAMALSGQAVVGGLNYVDPKTSVPCLLNCAERAVQASGSSLVTLLNSGEHLRNPRQAYNQLAVWYARRYIHTSRASPLWHMIAIGFVAGVSIKIHFARREGEYRKMVHRMEGLNEEDASLAAMHEMLHKH